MLIDFDLIFGMLVIYHDLQIEVEFCYAPVIFGEITGLGHGKFQRLNSFPDFFSKILIDFDLIFGMLVIYHDLQIEFEFCYAPVIFGEITGLGHGKFQRLNSFPDFFLNTCRY